VDAVPCFFNQRKGFLAVRSLLNLTERVGGTAPRIFGIGDDVILFVDSAPTASWKMQGPAEFNDRAGASRGRTPPNHDPDNSHA